MQPRDFLANEEDKSYSMPGRDFLQESEPNKESYATSIVRAIPRIGEDIYRSGMNALKSAPGYYESAKTEVPAFLKMLAMPGGISPHSVMQGIAGSQEAINNIAQLPKALTAYGENRLNLLPKGSEEFVSKLTPEDTTNAINQLFGEPKEKGEALFRGTIRNVPSLAALSEIPNMLNIVRPGKTASNIANKTILDIQNEYANGIKQQKIAYDKFYKPYGDNLLAINPKSYLGLNKKQIKSLYPTSKKLYDNFLENPSANNLHAFQSQVGKDAIKSRDEYLKQMFRDIQRNAHSKIENFAKKLNDPEAYAGLLEGKQITRDIVKPFESAIGVRKIAKKNINPNQRTFNQVKDMVKKANESGENILDPLTGEVKNKIRGVPSGHYLDTLQNELLKQTELINRRKMARNALLGLSSVAGLGLGGDMLRKALSHE